MSSAVNLIVAACRVGRLQDLVGTRERQARPGPVDRRKRSRLWFMSSPSL